MDMRFAELISPVLLRERMERAERRQREIDLGRQPEPRQRRWRFRARPVVTDRQPGMRPLRTASS